LLPNHGAGISYGARLHLHDITDASPDAPAMANVPSLSAPPGVASSSEVPGAVSTGMVRGPLLCAA
jgi:hypothetical protein